MSLTKYESSVKTIPYSCGVVYSQLADMNNMSKVREFFSDPERRESIAAQIPADKLQQIEDTLNKMTFDTDSVSVDAPMMGRVGLKVVEREEPKLVKFE